MVMYWSWSLCCEFECHPCSPSWDSIYIFWFRRSTSCAWELKSPMTDTVQQFCCNCWIWERKIQGPAALEGTPWSTAWYYLPSVNQLKSLLHHLRQDSAILNEYNDIFQDQLTRGIIEAVSPSAPPAAQAVHYLTYYPVIRHDKSTSKVCSIHCISLAHYDPLLQKIRGRADGRVPIERERV